MKLSMWILANMLELFEPEVHIHEQSPRVLRSARLAQATNCVYVQKDGPNCVYSWNGESIRIPDMPAWEGYELLQSLFDSMFDWHDQLSKAAESHDFQRLVNLCYSVFRNPIVLCNGNHKCLAMSTQYGPDDVDAEWKHLKTYGCPSLSSSGQLADAEITYHMSGEVVRFQFTSPGEFCNSLSSHLLFDGMPVGYLTVIEKDHPLNYGHMQLMQVVNQILIPVLSQENRSSDGQDPFFQQLMEGTPISPELARRIYEQKHWHLDHFYRVIIVDFGLDGDEQQLRERYFHFASLGSLLPDDICGIFNGKLVILANESLLPQEQQIQQMDYLLKNLSVQVAFSLPRQGFSLIPELFKQADFALEYLGASHREKKYIHFYDCAVDYLIRAPYAPETCLAACHPDVYSLFRNDEVLYRTLMVYLNQDRSVTRTIQYLYIHKNTLLHRLRKIEETLDFSLSDPYCRQYMRLSFMLLERHAGLPNPPAPLFPEAYPNASKSFPQG